MNRNIKDIIIIEHTRLSSPRPASCVPPSLPVGTFEPIPVLMSGQSHGPMMSSPRPHTGDQNRRRTLTLTHRRDFITHSQVHHVCLGSDACVTSRQTCVCVFRKAVNHLSYRTWWERLWKSLMGDFFSPPSCWVFDIKRERESRHRLAAVPGAWQLLRRWILQVLLLLGDEYVRVVVSSLTSFLPPLCFISKPVLNTSSYKYCFIYNTCSIHYDYELLTSCIISGVNNTL